MFRPSWPSTASWSARCAPHATRWSQRPGSCEDTLLSCRIAARAVRPVSRTSRAPAFSEVAHLSFAGRPVLEGRAPLRRWPLPMPGSTSPRWSVVRCPRLSRPPPSARPDVQPIRRLVPVAGVGARHLLPHRVDVDVVVAIGPAHPEEGLPPDRLAVLLHRPEGALQPPLRSVLRPRGVYLQGAGA